MEGKERANSSNIELWSTQSENSGSRRILLEMEPMFHRYSCYNNLEVHSMEMVFLVENMNFVVGMESLVEIHNYLDMVTLELAEVEDI